MKSESRLAVIAQRLESAYGRPRRWREDPLDCLIRTILSQNTTDANSGRAFESLKDRFPNWAAALAAPRRALERAIHSGGLARIKSGRIQEVLRRLKKQVGELTLDFLKTMKLEEARAYLRDLPGVGPKTASCVLLFSLHRPAFPVDTHVLRVTKRLDLIGLRLSMEAAHRALEPQVAPSRMLSLHLNLVRHGREICHPRRPECGRCVLKDLCPSAFKLC